MFPREERLRDGEKEKDLTHTHTHTNEMENKKKRMEKKLYSSYAARGKNVN